MKRKQSQNSPGKGYQIISKFFKTSSTQDVKDASRKATDSIAVSKPKLSLAGPVLRKLTKLRESLSRRAVKTDLLHLYRNEKKENMEEYGRAPSENRPQSSRDDAEMTSIDIEELNNCDKVNPSYVLQENAAISISSDSSLENITKNQELCQSPIDLDSEEECSTTDKNTFGFQDQSNKDVLDTDCCTINTSDLEISFKTSSFIEKVDESTVSHEISESFGDDTDTEHTCVGYAGNKDNFDQADKRDEEDIYQATTTSDELRSVTERLPINMDYQLSYDSQFSDTVNSEANDEASDSDDDLLLPPSFLYENTTKLEVCTPEKITTPFGASPMSSPVRPVAKVKQELNYRFTVNTLLKEKNKKETKTATLIKIEADLDAGIKKGGIKSMTDLISEDETDSELDDGKDLSKCKLPRELSKHLVKVSNFSEDLVGEDIFPELDNKILKCEMPSLDIPHPLKDEDTFLFNLMSSKPDEIKELINGGWMMQYYLKRPCPALLAEWVFHIMCFYPDTFVSSQCFKTLWALLRAGTEDQGGVPKGVRGMVWVPNIRTIILVLQHYGASLETIAPKELKNISPLLNDLVKKEEEYEICKSEGSSCRPWLIFLMGQLIQFLTHCLHMTPLNFTVNDLHLLLVISCRLSLDLRLQEFLFDMEMLIFEVLNCFGESQWEEEIIELPVILVHLSTNHRDLLHILHVLPLSERGSQLRTLTCVILIRFFIKEFSSENIICDSMQRTEVLQKISKNATSKVSKLLLLVDEIQPKQTSSYHLLHTIISLIDLAIGNEDQPPSERAELKKLASKLGSLNGDIKDPRAAYLDRTKVKDLLVRTVSKINFLVQAIEPPKERELTEYFETNSSEYEVHMLGETLLNNSDHNMENVSSPESGSISSPGGSNNSCNGSDQENLVDDEVAG